MNAEHTDKSALIYLPLSVLVLVLTSLGRIRNVVDCTALVPPTVSRERLCRQFKVFFSHVRLTSF